MMITLAAIALEIALAVMAGVRAQSGDEPLAVTARPGSSLTIRGSTTIGARWHCTATDIKATAIMKDGVLSIDAHEVMWVSVDVPVWKLRCQSGPMERAMRKAMRADKDTSSAIAGHFATDPGRPEATRAAHLIGTLTVTGITQNVELSAQTERSPDGMLRVRSVVPLTLSAFRITPPRVLFGAVRARDAITVEVNLVF
jgi:hypothetical protein